MLRRWEGLTGHGRFVHLKTAHRERNTTGPLQLHGMIGWTVENCKNLPLYPTPWPYLGQLN